MSIRLLDSALVQRIAAGEVIDRPCSIIRELLDNCIDAGSTSISVWIKGGGIDSIIVSDNGKGMSREDLALSCHPHATSKISVLDDLFSISTMGFRGEALYSIAACSKLTISSGGFYKTVDNTVEGPVEADPAVTRGTTIRAEDLFSQLPARKMFLKRPVTEGAMCRNMVLEKALAFPSIEFRFFSEDQLKLHLSATDARQRVIDALGSDENFIPSDTAEFSSENENFKLYGVGTTSDSYRSDRSQIKLFVNNHCVDDFSLVMAVTNGYSEQFPGGRFPYFFLFIDINPQLVDFNIHPAKRECRIRIKTQVNGWVTTMIRTQLKKKIKQVSVEPHSGETQPELCDVLQTPAEAPVPRAFPEPGHYEHRPFEVSDLSPEFRGHSDIGVSGSGFRQGSAPKAGDSAGFESNWFENARKVMANSQKNQFREIQQRLYRYIGQAFKLFLVVEKEGKLLFVDQHAAHERILFDEFKEDKQVQRLLIPFRFEVERDTDAFLLENSYIYSDFGIELTRPEEMVWELNTIPQISRGVESRIAAFIKDNTGDIDEIEKNLFSTLACRAAIKAGDEIDQLSALSLLDKVFLLDKPCCPHGRTFITEITEKSLREAVGRFI